MTLKGGTSQACAACKYQRRKCIADCPLAPYFPPDQPKMFQNAHRLFGVSNILKILKQIDPIKKRDAMHSIIYQADIRDKYPVHGCVWVISQLNYQILQAKEELYAVRTQLALYRQQQQHEISSAPNDSASQLQLGMVLPNNALTLFHQEPPQPYNAVAALPIASHLAYSNGNNVGYSSGYIDLWNGVIEAWCCMNHNKSTCDRANGMKWFPSFHNHCII